MGDCVRAQGFREEREDLAETKEATIHDFRTEKRYYKRSRLQMWGLSVKRRFQILNGS